MTELFNPFAAMVPEAAYIHVPFCASKCYYCDFYSCTPKPEDFALYEQAFYQETRLLVESRQRWGLPIHPLRSVYFGGGTPSFLPAAMTGRMLEQLESLFGLCSDCEITLEANPSKALPKKLPELRRMGFNRLSMGLQSADNRLLKRIGRLHTAEDFACAAEAAVKAGFHNFSSDIILGLPGQTLEGFKLELDWLLQFPLTHLSYYSLQLEEGTRLGDELLRDPSGLPSELEERAMYHYLADELPRHALYPYEISNAGAEGCASRHNLVYWNAEPYFAFGPSAASYDSGIRRHNPHDLKVWAEAVMKGREAYPAAELDECIDGRGARSEYVMLRLRLAEGVRFESYEALFGEDLRERFGERVLRLVRRGLLQMDGEHIALSALGRDLANQAFLEFI